MIRPRHLAIHLAQLFDEGVRNPARGPGKTCCCSLPRKLSDVRYHQHHQTYVKDSAQRSLISNPCTEAVQRTGLLTPASLSVRPKQPKRPWAGPHGQWGSMGGQNHLKSHHNMQQESTSLKIADTCWYDDESKKKLSWRMPRTTSGNQHAVDCQQTSNTHQTWFPLKWWIPFTALRAQSTALGLLLNLIQLLHLLLVAHS